MTALTLALVAGMALGSDGAERISIQMGQCLDVDGYWEGVLQIGDGRVFKARLEPGLWITEDQGRKETLACRWVDEGQGKCQFWNRNARLFPSIYRYEAGQLIVCFGYDGDRPARFQAKGGDLLLIVKRVKPPKK
jgi:hypothetical protein